MKKTYRLPNGEITTSIDKFEKEWTNRIKVIENLTDGRLIGYGFDPDISFIDNQGGNNINLPIWLIDLIDKKLDK